MLMIFIGIGSNIAAMGLVSPEATIRAAIDLLDDFGITLVKLSKFYLTSPVPASNQPWFVNCVAQIETFLSPFECMANLHRLEYAFQRVRSVPNASRTLDLDLLDYNGLVIGNQSMLRLPHPRINERAFVLFPLSDICSNWVSPLDGSKIEDLINKLSIDDTIKPLN
jgi:2-amino-4-hydroxy-6-hydroxymethyldihydropteridine diphosphokinase